MKPILRYSSIAALVAIAGFTATKFVEIRETVDALREVSQDNILWTATQMEVELLRLQFSLALLASERTDEALSEMQKRFDLLYSRVDMAGSGRVGDVLDEYDENHDAIANLSEYLDRIDPTIVALEPRDTANVKAVIEELNGFQRGLRLHTLRVIRSDALRFDALVEAL